MRLSLLRCIGDCWGPFLIAVLFDIIGLVLLFVGIFANLRIGGRFYGDFLIYSGALILFFSLFFWLIWYMGNVRAGGKGEEEEEEEEGGYKRSSMVELARKLSERLSQKVKGDEPVKKFVEDLNQEGEAPGSMNGKVTWGKSTAYYNEGYDSTLDYSDEKNKEVTPDTT
ncbi:transmembrane protein 238 [Pholidichthys leucotaenia]